MDYTTFKAPYIEEADIQRKAEYFRQKYWNDTIPVDIENIIETKLGIEIIPVANFDYLCDGDALITSNWKAIYIDSDKYLDERFQNRFRFSFAHEIGHFILHKEIYKSFQIKSYSDFYNFFEQIDQNEYNYFEIQANKFAGYLLVPEEKLKSERKKLLKDKNSFIQLDRIDDKTINSYIATPLSSKFGVSSVSMEISLNKTNFS